MTGIQGVLDGHEVQRAVILSGIGSVVEARFLGVQPGAARPFMPSCVTRMETQGPFEILTLEGNIFPSSQAPVVHLHVTLGTSDGAVIGGHLVDAEVYTTVEIFLAAMDTCRIGKVKDSTAGGFQLKFPKSSSGGPASRSRKSVPSRAR
jgi:predicted DNA-binding protein with PD1-like motif